MPEDPIDEKEQRSTWARLIRRIRRGKTRSAFTTALIFHLTIILAFSTIAIIT
jgi:hypothetical protein